MQIKFCFNLEKSLSAIAYFLKHLGALEKVKLTKLLYLGDRSHFLRTGVPITGDAPWAMPHGPVPSRTLDAINGEVQPDEVFKVIHVEDYTVYLRPHAVTASLTETEQKTLQQVIAAHGDKEAWDLVRETHHLPEYLACHVDGTSRPIPYEKIAEVAGDESRFRHNRPVISPETAAAMPCPFPPEPDL